MNGRTMKAGAGGRAGMAIPLVLGALLLISIFALTSSLQASATRGTLERTRAEGLLRTAANSAVEEACAVLEETLTPPAYTGADAQRDLGRTLSWPATVEPVNTRQSVGVEGAVVSAVKVESSQWMVQVKKSKKSKGKSRVRESGVLKLTVNVKVPVNGAKLEKTFTICRYVSARKSRRTGQPKLSVAKQNLYAQDGDR